MNPETIEADYIERPAPLAVRDEAPAAIPMPTVSPEEARDAMRRYLELCEAVLTPDDYQEFEQWDPKLRTKVKKRFKKKSAVKKLQTFFSVSVVIKDKQMHDLSDGHFAWSVTATAATPGGRPVEATGGCSTMEERFEIERKESWTDSDYAYRVKKANARSFHDVLSTAETRATNRAVMNCIGVGGGEVTADEIRRPKADADTPPSKPAAPPALPPVVAALCDRWRAATGGDEAAFRAKYTGQKVADIRASVEAAEAEKAPATAQEQANNDVPEPARVRQGVRSAPGLDTSSRGEAGATAAPKPVAQRTREKAMALFADLGYDDAGRHEWYAASGIYAPDGSVLESWADVVKAKKESAVIDLLLLEKGHREEMELLEAALPRAGE